MDWKNKKVLVAGCGISGIAAVGLLARQGASPILFDENTALDKEAVRKKLGSYGETEILTGSLTREQLNTLELAVLSPGIPLDCSFVKGLEDAGLPIIGEIELAWLCAKGRVAAITGTNGKTTTTALTGKIMEDWYGKAFVVGNIGNPYTSVADETEEDSVTVAEISSFQLETTKTFRPSVSAILNLTPDHLNRHGTMENYAAIKERIAAGQTKEEVCVLNAADPYTKSFAERCQAAVVLFSSEEVLENGYYLQGEDIVLAENGNAQKLINIHEMKLLGKHNMENVMAAIAITSAFGVPMESILDTVRSFRAVEHRIEYVDTIRGVDYYNDSKGTNPDAAIKAVQAMNRPVVLIGGGYDKDGEYDAWVDTFFGKVTWLILLGQTREKIADCARRKGFSDIIMVDSLEEAVQAAHSRANSGEAVLLSPACASWGMFTNYEERGNLFKEYVKNLKES